MSIQIGSYEVKTKLSELLRRVERGESFTITNRGQPVAELVPLQRLQYQKKQDAIKAIMESQKEYLSDEALIEAKQWGRK